MDADCIFIGMGTPENKDGSANLNFLEAAALQIAEQIKKDIIFVIKSTVPVGTNEHIEHLIQERVSSEIKIEMISNPEFLREGTAIYDTFHGDRIVIGANSEIARNRIMKIYEPFCLPVVQTDIRSTEMIKYASNSFLALKIIFINEIANLC